MNLPEELIALAEEFRIYARAECKPASVEQWERWADTCEAGGKNLANRDEAEALIFQRGKALDDTKYMQQVFRGERK
jgi:hypothetical protein